MVYNRLYRDDTLSRLGPCDSDRGLHIEVHTPVSTASIVCNMNNLSLPKITLCRRLFHVALFDKKVNSDEGGDTGYRWEVGSL